MTDTYHQPLFDLQHLGLSYRAKPVLRGINWTWTSGEHWAVLGPNGSGKTALATVLCGEQTHYSGHYKRSPRLNKGVAYVCFERGRKLFERDQKLDCGEFESSGIDTGTRVRDLLQGATEDQKHIEELIQLLELEAILERGLRYISTGEMRKTLLATALLSKPELLILDSPLDGLDVAMQQRLRQVLDRVIARSPGVLLLCRSPEEVPAACSHLMLLDRGRIVAAGEAATVRQLPELRQILDAPSVIFGASATEPAAAAEKPSQPTLELRDVSVSFGDLCVFKDLHWTLQADQHCLIAGPNGSGKSTLLDLLTGDNHKAYGQDVRLFGQRRGQGESIWDIKARFGRVDARMQFAVPSGSAVLAVVISGFYDSLGLRDRPSDRQRSASRRWLRLLGLEQWEKDEFHTLSFGMQRLVLLARAMVREPAILLLDEATLSLDKAHRRLLLAAVDHVVEAGRCQLLFVSHTAGEVPRCINQRLLFTPCQDGSRVDIENLDSPTQGMADDDTLTGP